MNAMRTLSLVDTRSRVLVGEAELVRRRIERGIKTRQRYRYVEPEVQIEGEAWLIRSPCCSRNVDPEGGVIDIAFIERLGEHWRLYSRNHAEQRWQLYDEFADIPTLLAILCEDPHREFWP